MPRSASQATLVSAASPRLAHRYNPACEWLIEKPAEIVAAIADWEADPDQLETALIESGFARREGDTFILHQWEDQNKKLFTSYANGKKGGKPKSESPKALKKPAALKL